MHDVTLKSILDKYISVIDSPFEVELSDGKYVKVLSIIQRYEGERKFLSLITEIPLVPKEIPVLKELSNDTIIKIAKETTTAEPGRDGYILPVAFARAIELFLKS